VHEKKPVIIPNVKWLDGVVHPNTIKFFNLHSTKTAAFIPVLGADSSTVVGVYWVEGVKGAEISYSDKELFNSLIGTLSERIKLMLSDTQLHLSQASLAQFLPKHLVADYLSGKDVKEVDHGYLMMFDLKGSTRLAHALGNAFFHEEVSRFKDQMEMLLRKYGWSLQEYIWDAFSFTLSVDQAKSEKTSVQNWAKMIESTFDKWKEEIAIRHGDIEEIGLLSYRVCFSFGDVSRGIVVEGNTRKWTFIGNAIAVVSKIEQESKKLPGKVFCDESILSRSTDTWIMLHTSSHGLVVYGIVQNSEEESKAA
jgi:class 3 adenylate cyclase